MTYNKQVRLKDGSICLIRNTDAADAAEVVEQFRIHHDQTDYLSSYGDECRFTTDEEACFLARKASDPRDVHLCAVIDGHIIGLAGISGLSASKAQHRAELGVSITKTHWGIGIGRALIESCIECAKSAGYTQLELEVVADNVTAITLYHKMGFIEYGRNPRGFVSRYSGYQELISMRLELE